MRTTTKTPKAEPSAEAEATTATAAAVAPVEPVEPTNEGEPVVPAAGRYTVRRRRSHGRVLYGRHNEHLIATQVPAEVRDEWQRLGQVTFVPDDPAAPDTAPPAAPNPE